HGPGHRIRKVREPAMGHRGLRARPPAVQMRQFSYRRSAAVLELIPRSIEGVVCAIKPSLPGRVASAESDDGQKFTVPARERGTRRLIVPVHNCVADLDVLQHTL